MTKSKIEESELNDLKMLNDKIVELKSQIADCEVQTARAQRMKSAAVEEIQQVAETLSGLQISLREKYGDITVNLRTGEYDA